jgi:mono/diheme cytochrome c family protein
MSAGGIQPAHNRAIKDRSPRVMAAAALNLVSIVGFCLMVTSCSYRQSDQADAGELTPAPEGAQQGGGDDQKGIAEAWKEEDRIVHEHLDSSGWINREAGVAHIPIDRAMDLILLEKRSSGPQSDVSENTGAHEKDTALRSAGRALFRKYGCNACHSPSANPHAPSLVGIYGETVRLSDGTFVRADEQYLRDSILHAGKRMVAGYAPSMPSYNSYIPEHDVLELIAYLKSFTGTKDDPAARSP